MSKGLLTLGAARARRELSSIRAEQDVQRVAMSSAVWLPLNLSNV